MVVLVVGPGHAWRLPVVTTLQRGGYATIEANDGFEALQAVIDNRIDLMISGDEMKGLTGREMIGVIKRHEAIVRCILVSEAPDGADGLPEGVGFLEVPFEPEDLLSKIKGILSKTKAA
jgi:CheY-like chemotaxis protein